MAVELRGVSIEEAACTVGTSAAGVPDQSAGPSSPGGSEPPLGPASRTLPDRRVRSVQGPARRSLRGMAYTRSTRRPTTAWTGCYCLRGS